MCKILKINQSGERVRLVQVQKLLNSLDELFCTKWLRDVVVRAGFQAVEPGKLGGHGGEHNNRNAGSGGVAPQDLANGETVQFGEHDVEEDQVGGQGTDFFECFSSIGGGADGKTAGFEIKGEQFNEVIVVLHHQNLLSHCSRNLTWRRRSPQCSPSYVFVTGVKNCDLYGDSVPWLQLTNL